MGEQGDSSAHPSHSEEMRTALPGYAAAIALGQAAPTHYPYVAACLKSCPACRAELEALLELVMPAYTGQVVPVASQPQFELSFLPSQAARAVEVRQSWYIDSLRRLVVEFSQALLESIQQPAVAQAARGQLHYHYTPQPAPPDNLGLTIDVFADDNAPDQGNVQVLIDVPGRDPLDQAGIRVTLRVGDLVWEGATGPSGSVTFTAVPLALLPQLRVEVALPPEMA
jgi:hypothetical protein